MIVLVSNSVENIHRIQRKAPMSGPALLDHQHLLKERGMGDNNPIQDPEPEPYETTYRSTQTLGPVEKKPYGGQQDLSRDYKFKKMIEKDLGKERKNDNPKYTDRKVIKTKKVKKVSFKKESQRTQDIVYSISPSFANVTAILGNQQSDGSGFFISKNHFVTAAHVVFLTTDNENNNQVINNVKVGLNIRGRMYQAYIVDYNVLKDFVTLFVDSVGLGLVNYIKPINLGNSSNVKAGEHVVLIGNPIDNSIGVPTATYGIVSVGSDVAQRGMFVVDAEALEGMSGGMVYSVDRKAVIGIISGYFSNNIDKGGATTLTICAGIDSVKNSSKKKKIPFIYKESGPTQSASLNSKIVESNNFGSTFKDDDKNHQKNESVGGMGGPGKGRSGKNPKKNFEMSVTQGPGNKSIPLINQYTTTHGRDLYMDTSTSINSSPFDDADADIKEHPRVQNRMNQLEDEKKGQWMFNIPLGYKGYGEDSIIVYKKDDNFYAYYNGKKIYESLMSDENKNPLLTLMKKIKSKYGFDESYENYIEDYGLGILQ